MAQAKLADGWPASNNKADLDVALNASEPSQHGAAADKYYQLLSLHGDTVSDTLCKPETNSSHETPSVASIQAARRRAITELLFFASSGDLRRCQRITRLWNLKVSAFVQPSSKPFAEVHTSNVPLLHRLQTPHVAITTKGHLCECLLPVPIRQLRFHA